MKKKKNNTKGIVVIALFVVAVVAVVFLFGKKSGTDLETRNMILSQTYDLDQSEDISYQDYIGTLGELKYLTDGTNRVEVAGDAYSETSMMNLKKESGFVITQDTGSITYEFDVKESGLYNLEVTYYPVTDTTLTIVRNLYINGKLPFDNAKGITFERSWEDDSKNFLMQTNGNQAGPTQVQKEEWAVKKVNDPEFGVAGPFSFYLEKGKNSITFESEQAQMGISNVALVPVKEIPSYDQYLENCKSQGFNIINKNDLSDGAVIVQAEDTLVKTNSTLAPLNDRTSVKSQPYHYTNIVYNTIGGENWSASGDGITWQIEVPKDGLYKIGSRFKQYMNRDFYSIREIQINGEIPFKEAAQIQFDYATDFQTGFLGDEEGNPYYFYLHEGANTFTMTVSLGELKEAADLAQESVKNLNNLYREITSVTGTSPDKYRDYDIIASIPDLVDILKKEYYRLDQIIGIFGEDISGGVKSSDVAQMMLVMEKIIKKPDVIAKQLSNFNDKLSALSDWMLSLDNQPLELDYLVFCGDDYNLPKAEGNFFENVTHTVRAFIGSFTNDYQVTMNSDVKKTKSIEVWVSTTIRSEYEVIQRMINNHFKDSDIAINLKMVKADAVMPATVTGNGPDVALQLNYSVPINFAFRNAAYDLTAFEDFEQVASEFADGAMEYFEFDNGYYGLPDQMSFPVLFYRKDILSNLGLELPKTWKELEAMIPYLEAENMSVFFNSTDDGSLGRVASNAVKPVNSVFLSMLYQNGLELYKEDGKSSALDQNEALLIFKNWTEYYTKQGLDQTINVVTRFRTGEVPLIIEDYTYRNTIIAAAPEIDGAWGIAPIPGTLKEDGTIDHTSSCTVGGSMIIKNSVEKNKNVDSAWEFLKWWVSADTQLQYSNELKAVLGSAAEYPIANVRSIEQLPLDSDTKATVLDIVDQLRGTPQVPGGYITGRVTLNAFLKVITNNIDAVDTLYLEVKDINNEITIKRREFGLDN